MTACLINGDVPQEVVRRLLDHSTHHMTARYARLSQQTIRAKWEAARKVDIRGLDVSPPEGPLADAEWMKNNLARAKRRYQTATAPCPSSSAASSPTPA
jgi:hypothetical protein